jgi:predicted XRE-type DNA-binding protein
MARDEPNSFVRYEDFDDLRNDLGLSTEEVEHARRDTEDYVRAWRLGQVRRDQHRSQQDIADAMEVSQPRISAIEQGDLSKVNVSTLRAYVEALGGRLHIVADFEDQQYRLT